VKRSTTSTHHEQSGFTLIELIVVVALVGIVVGVAIPGFVRARVRGQETSAIGSLWAVNDAQASYAMVCGYGDYAVLFATLGVHPPGSATGFLSSDLTSAEIPIKSGYRYTLGPGLDGKVSQADCNGTETYTTYYASAVPIATGRGRGFATNQDRDIWQNTTGLAPMEPFRPDENISLLPPN
jgi:type IV pilus assembly protein PilA